MKILNILKKGLVSVLVVVMAFTVVNLPAVSAMEEDVIYDINTIVSEDKKAVQVQLDAYPGLSNVEVSAIGNPDGTISEGASSTYTSTRNETLTFVVNYKVFEETEGKIKESSKTKEVVYEVTQIEEEQAVKDAVPTAQEQITPFAIQTNMNFKTSFKMNHTKDGLYYLADNSFELGYHYNEFLKYQLSGVVRCTVTSYWEGWYAKFSAVSKYEVDFSKDFQVTNLLSSDSSLYGDGFTMGFQTNPNLVYTPANGGSIGIYRNGASILGARNGVIFEVDYHDNGSDWKDTGLGANHIAIHTTNEYGNETAPIAYTKNIKHTGGLMEFNVVWNITDEATNTGTLTFTYGSYTLKYPNFQPYKVFGGTQAKPTPAYLTYTGVLLKDYGSKNQPFQLTMTDYSYLHDEVYASNGFITQTQAKALANQNGLIAYNKASAVSKAGESVTPMLSIAGWGDIQSGNIGSYDVTYSYGDAEKTVKITIIKDGSVISPDQDFSLFAESATLTQAEAMALVDVTALIAVHNAEITKIDGTTTAPAVYSSNWNAVKAGTVGSYTTTFGYGTGTNYVEKKVTLMIVADKKHEVHASNGFITQTQAKALTDTAALIPYNSASVITSDGAVATPDTITTPSWTLIKAGTIGSYAVTYAYGSGNMRGETTVTLYVVKDGSVFPPDNSFMLYAQNGFIKQSEAKNLTSTNQLIAYNDASVLLGDGALQTPLVIVANWANIVDGAIGSYDIVYTYGNGANQVYKTVKLNVVEDGAIIAPDNSFALYAEAGVISQTQSSVLSTQNQLIPYNNARVTLANGTRATPNVQAPTFDEIVIGEVKTHKVTYRYGELLNAVSVEVDLVLTADRQHVIHAEDAFIYEHQAKVLTHQNELIPYNSASVTTNTGQTAIPVVTTGSWANIVAGVKGSYNITYSYGSGTTQGTKTVVLTVVDDGAVFPPSKAFALYADNGLINVEQAKALDSLKDLIPYNSASVILKDGTVVNPDVATTSWVLIAAGIEGTYSITYSYEANGERVSKTVSLTLTKGTTPPSNSFALYARDGFIYENLAMTLTGQQDLIPYNEALVTLKDGSSAEPQVATSHYSLIKAGTIGTYPITYGYTKGSESLTKTVQLNVIETGAVISPDHDFALYAQNGIIQSSDAQALMNRNELISYNKAKVTLKDGTLQNPTVTTTDWIAIRAGVIGTYRITYSYGTGANLVQTTVILRVVPDGTISPDGDFILYASDGFISQVEAKAIASQSDLIPYNAANVIKFDGTEAKPTVSTASYADIKSGKLGTYNVAYRYGFGTNEVSKTVKLTVHNGEVSPGGNYVLSASDGFISQTEAKALVNPNEVIALNKASVVKKDGSTALPVVTILPTNWLSMNAGISGMYPVLYSYGSGNDYTQKTVNIIVYDDGGTVSPDKDFVLHARDAVISQSEAKALLNEDNLTIYNNAVVTKITGEKVTPNTTASEFASIHAGTVGVYAVTYDYGTGTNHTEKTVKLVVVKDGALIAPDRSFAICADDVMLSQAEAKALANKAEFIALANATVALANGMSDVPTVNVDAWNDIKAGQSGTYEVTFAYKGVSGAIIATVTQQYKEAYLFDYDGNSRVDILDYAEFTSYMNGIKTVTKDIMYISDANKDGRIDVLDLAEINRYLSNPNLPLVVVQIPL